MRVVLVGAGAQAKYAAETFRLRGVEVAGVMNSRAGAELEWPEAYGARALEAGSPLGDTGATHFVICMADAAEKARWWDRAEEAGLAPVRAIHPAAVIATTARVGDGCIVNACAVIQPFATIGRGVMIHANVTVEHDVVVEDFANLAPGVKLAGWVHVGERATVYTGASVIPRVRIGRDAVVGAGAAVTEDVPPGSLAVGVPAKTRDPLP